jgi:DNA-binding SARP family transcriptional activator
MAAAPAGRFPVLVCLLGSFRVFSNGAPVALRPEGKAEQLLHALALRPQHGVERDELVGIVWPTGDYRLARQSLNTLLYSLRRTFADGLGGRTPILREEGRYRLNTEDGVAIDVDEFDAAVATGDRVAGRGDHEAAIRAYEDAVLLYSGDLVVGSDVEHVVERERLRARYLSAHARVADLQFELGNYDLALRATLELLAHDPCREDGHRMAMRCYVRIGERAQALRQYRICQDMLALEFSAVPEQATDALYELVRLEPGRV